MVARVQLHEVSAAAPGEAAFARDVRVGLARSPKQVSSSWFYDARGSQLFQEITRQAAYYLTRCEREILERHAREIAKRLGGDQTSVFEIGAGDGHKTEILLARLLQAGVVDQYVPIDICRQSVVALTNKLRHWLRRSPIQLRGIVADYFDAFPLLSRQSRSRKLVLFLGSSIGNYSHRQARQLLASLRAALEPGDLVLIGFDLKKDLLILQQAYDDPAGVTREFNLNLLDRINRELGGRFDRRRFFHHAVYNLRLGCMESWLVSREAHEVPIEALGLSVSLSAWEGIRVERSYKYDLAQIEALARTSGFEVERHYLDSRGYFADSLWRAAGPIAPAERRAAAANAPPR